MLSQRKHHLVMETWSPASIWMSGETIMVSFGTTCVLTMRMRGMSFPVMEDMSMLPVL